MASGEAEDWLAPGERVLIRTKPHWKSFAGLLLRGSPLGLFLLIWGLVLVSYRYARAEGLIILALDLLLFLIVFFVGLLRWRTTDYYVTDQRVATRHGVLIRAGADVPLDKVNSVRFRHGVTDRIFGTGTLLITPGSFWSVKLRAIPDTQKVHAVIYNGARSAAEPVLAVGQAFASGPPPPASPYTAPPLAQPRQSWG